MVQVTYPGVYVQEIPSTVRPIAAVSTSVGAFIDWFREGPMNRAVEIFGMADFERVFSGIDVRSEASYAISQFFLNGGSRAYIVRVTPPTGGGTAATARVIVQDAPGGGKAFEVAALNQGDWGNHLRVAIDPIVDPLTQLVSLKRFSLSVYRYATARDPGPPIATEKFLNVSIENTDSRYYVSVVTDASQLVRLISPTTDTPAGTDKLPAVTGTISGAITATIDNTFLTTLNAKTFKIQIGDDTAARTATVVVPTGTAPADLRTVRGLVETAIRGAPRGTADAAFDASYAGATVELFGKKLIVRAGRRSSKYAPAQRVVITLDGTGLFTTTVVNVQEYLVGDASVASTAQVGSGTAGVAVAGSDGNLPNADALKGQRVNKTGMYALEDADIFNLLCIPRVSVKPDISDDDFTAVVAEAVAYCEERRAMLLVDIPAAVNSVQKMKDWTDANATTIRSKNAAVYYPRLEIPDSQNEYRLRSVGPSGTMAGVYARTDTERGVWKAPAGIEAALRGVGGLDDVLTDLQNGALNPLGINCMRSLPVYGQVAWGARTLYGADVQASEWKYIPIRRLALMIEESLFRGTKWVVFEPNDEPLWAKIRQNVGAFMMNLFRQGAFQGSTPDKAFFVKCDGETTTAIDRNLGIVNIEVGFAPLKPAEFVVLKIQQIPDIT